MTNQKIMQQMNDNIPEMCDGWAYWIVNLLLLKSPMVIKGWNKCDQIERFIGLLATF